ncbi:mpv17-like protein [Oncorhynchus kisutch]|uniref:mpv17-like protein n=1 Tax=Oncorhynchus kisutch TaxID=8019 RepID=UPI0012DBCFF6|nr:mpv17-like protein [Oncorhynchus kisutch]XP_031643191.1 mpv17-like protein [Oncorhynchus kisutch]XP_031643192.1 mpv17-like protein [Oncorhynchus kisutch]
MSRAWALFKAHPYISNVVGYTTLFASADLIQQSMLGGKQSGGLNTDKGTHIIHDSEGAKLNMEGTNISTGTKSVTTWADIDWSQTARVAFVGFCFHANFNYHWLKGLERMLPGGGAKRVSGKVVLDQLVAAPATISAFFIGLSVLENKEDPLENWREKFWTSYKTGVVYWSTMQALNFSLVPPVARTVFVGGITLVWTVFLCHFRQQKDDTQTKPPSH